MQLSFLEAFRDLADFRGQSVGEFASWLRTLLEHNASRLAERHLDAQRRSLRRESQSSTESGQRRMIESAPHEQSSPSRRAMRGEDAVWLATALAQLPEDQAEAIRLRHLEGLSLKQMSERLRRSETAVAGLVKRGLQKLKTMLPE